MKIAFLSDIHGNAEALEQVLNDIESRSPDRIMVLGDLCYRGLEPKRALQRVRSLDAEVIKGNADEWVLRDPRSGEVPEGMLDIMKQERAWTVSKLSEEDLDYLRNLPREIRFEVEGMRIHAFHATPDSLFDIVLPEASNSELQAKLMKTDADVYVYAHIHRPFIRFFQGKCVINLGSVGLPFDGLRQSSYAMVELHEGNVQASIIRVFYDHHKVIRQVEDSDYPNRKLLKQLLLYGSPQ